MCVALRPKLFQVDYRVIPSVVAADGPISTLASFVVEAGESRGAAAGEHGSPARIQRVMIAKATDWQDHSIRI